MSEKSYNYYWAQDVLRELHHEESDELALDWVLRWMKRNYLEPEESSIIQMADTMEQEFIAYAEKRAIKSGTRAKP